MFLPFYAIAMFAPSPTVHGFLPETTGPITITPENVDLYGAGTVEFQPDRAAFDIDPPVGNDGISVTVRLWFDAKGQPVSCDTGQSPLPKVAQTGCNQLLQRAMFRVSPRYWMPFRKGFMDIEFSFFKDAPGAPAGVTVFASPFPGYINTEITYAPNQTPQDKVLVSAKLIFQITENDYPTLAMRYGMQSTSRVLLGVDTTGKIRECRPTGGPHPRNTAFLDDYTCAAFMKRAHFEFLPGAVPFEGLHYRTQSLAWRIPQL